MLIQTQTHLKAAPQKTSEMEIDKDVATTEAGELRVRCAFLDVCPFRARNAPEGCAAEDQ